MKISTGFSLIFLTTTLLVTISTGCYNAENCCTLIDTDVNIHYTNKEGKDLINSQSKFDESNIRVYYKNGEKFEFIYNVNLDAPNMHKVKTDENGNLILNVLPSNYYKGKTSTTLIEVTPDIKDTLFCEFDLGENREVCKKAWLNGVEMKDRFIKVVK